MKTKDRRGSGRIHNKIYDPEIGAYNTVHWNDWQDYRDGQRNIGKDFTKRVPKYKRYWCVREENYRINKKIKHLNRIRMLKKLSKMRRR